MEYLIKKSIAKENTRKANRTLGYFKNTIIIFYNNIYDYTQIYMHMP